MERISQKEKFYVQQVLDTQFKSSSGATFMNKLEKEFSKAWG